MWERSCGGCRKVKSRNGFSLCTSPEQSFNPNLGFLSRDSQPFSSLSKYSFLRNQNSPFSIRSQYRRHNVLDSLNICHYMGGCGGKHRSTAKSSSGQHNPRVGARQLRLQWGRVRPSWPAVPILYERRPHCWRTLRGQYQTDRRNDCHNNRFVELHRI